MHKTDHSGAGVGGDRSVGARKAWARPTVSLIAAQSAELGIVSTNDGGDTGS